jgi:hypothetical protein
MIEASNTVAGGGGLMSIAKCTDKRQVRYYHVHGIQRRIMCKNCTGKRHPIDNKVYEVRRRKAKAFIMDNMDILQGS